MKEISTKGNALPIRFSRRIKSRNLPVRVSPKRKIRKLPVKKRASGVNSFLLKAKVKVGKKNKLEETPNQASKILKRATRNFKPVIRKSPRLSISKVCNKKGKTRNSLQASLVYLKNNKISLKNLELADKSKVIEKKDCKKFVNEEKQSVCKNLRLSKSSPKEKGKNKEFHDIDLKPSKEKPSQRKSTKQVTTLSSGPVLTPNLKRCTHIPKLSGRKKSARLSKEPQNQEISEHMSASKSLALTPVPGKVTRISRHSGNRKSGRLSKEPQNQEIFVNTPASKLFAVTPVPGKVTRLSRHSGNRKSGRLPKEPIKSRIMDSETSLNTSSFFSLLETPQPEKHPGKRKTSRSIEQSPLRTLNKELPLSTPAYLLKSNADSTLSKSSKSCKSAENLLTESRSRKQSKPKVFTKGCSTVSHEKQKQQVNQHQKTSKNFKKPLLNETENLPLDSLTTPAFKAPCGRSLSKKYLSKSDSKNSKRKLNVSAAENQIVSEELQDAKKRKSAGDNICLDNSTIPLKYRSMKKSVSPAKIDQTKKQIKYRNFESYLTPVVNILGKVDILTADLFEKKSKRKVRSVPFENEINCVSYFSKGKRKNINSNGKKVKYMPCGDEILSSIRERKGKSTGNLKMKRVKRLVPHMISPNLNSALSIKTSSDKTIKQCLAKKPDNHETPQVASPPIKMDCLTSDLYKFKRRRTKSEDIELLFEERTSALSKKKWIRPLSPMRFTSNVSLKTESNLPNAKLGTLFPLPIDDLTVYKSASCSPNVDRLVNVLSPCFVNKKKTHSWPLGNELSSEISAKDDFPKIPAKGTLKRKRWLLNNLKEKNGSYEDDIFENKNFDLYKQAFHFGDESDGSSVNIATPKFDCILTPALPKKTPRYKDCYSPTEFLQARKTAEEYLHRRNKKRKSGERPSSSGKKSNANKKKTVQEIPEKKKLDFEEAVNKLIAVQKNLEIEAEVDNEEEDSYFSDASN